MSDYSIEIIKSVKDNLKSLKHKKEKAIKKIITLENNPIEKSKSLSGTLKGLRSFKFSLKDGQYRAIFKILEENKICLMIIIGSRQNIYLEQKEELKFLKNRDCSSLYPDSTSYTFYRCRRDRDHCGQPFLL